MELTGKLSDFGLTDILQILALSKKTGTLSISNHTYEGQIVIEEGRITFSYMRPGESFATYLQQEGVLSDAVLQELLEQVTRNHQEWDFARLLIEKDVVSPAALTEYVHGYLLKVIGNLLRLEKGHFGIVLGEIGLPGFFDEVKYAEGLGIEEVLLRDAKEYDELSRQQERLFSPLLNFAKSHHPQEANLPRLNNESPTPRHTAEPSPPRQTSEQHHPRPTSEQHHHRHTGNLEYGIRNTGNLDASLLNTNGYPGSNANSDAQRSHSLVSAVAISNGFPHPSEAATDSYTAAARREFSKPLLPEVDDDERLHLWDESEAEAEEKNKANNSNILCSLLAELRSLSFEAEVSLSVMRYASEVASRGILFVVKNEELCGLGQFGVDRQVNGGSVDDQVRAIRIPIKVQSIFTNVVKTGIPYVGPMSNGYWNLDVVTRLGEAVDELNAFVLPLFCLEKVMFVIYGDNYPGGKDFEGFEEFLVFVNQASVILENIVLERKLLFMQEA
ncbi:MAG: DUF4388 domain-containing protein [Acidobacteria bacterium]|nr:DUF4388 domain-containing protein [Acidobacteriota bacterium]